jgi:energy-coupling factor transporter ATP-binding protein EcfA2
MPTEGAPPSLRLMKLSARDFRGIDRIELDLTKADGEPLDLVVLAGGNGCGKTALLEAILLVLGRPDLLPKDAAPLREQIRFGVDRFELAADLRFTGENVEDFRATLEVDFATPDHSSIFSTRPDGVQTERTSGWSCSATGTFWPSIEYFSARREPETLGKIPEVRGAQAETEAERLQELKRRLRSASIRDWRAGRKPGESAPFARIQRFWQRLSGEAQVLDVLPVDNDPGSGEEVVLREPKPIPEDVTSLAMARRLASTRPDIPRMVPLDRLSSGQMGIFAFAGPIVFRDRPPDIVLIDEPEQHLHVQWQRDVLDALRELSPSTLYVVATHSEEILGSVLSYERFILVEESDPRARVAQERDTRHDQDPA